MASVLGRLAGSSHDSPRERARKASREITRMNNDAEGLVSGQRSKERENMIAKWILRVTHRDKDGAIDFADWIQDGTVMMGLMNCLSFNAVTVDPFAPRTGSEEERRARDVVEALISYGVESKFLFKPEDLVMKRNTPKIVRCLEELQTMALKDTSIELAELPANKVYV